MNNLDSKVLSNCIDEQHDGVLINIEVKPGSKNIGIEGIDEWRNCLEVRLKARAEKGKANKELVKLLSTLLALPSSNIMIVKGEKSHRKTIKIFGLKADELVRILTHQIEEKRT
jgi:uncharacterized protein (TIGR00251 family)